MKKLVLIETGSKSFPVIVTWRSSDKMIIKPNIWRFTPSLTFPIASAREFKILWDSRLGNLEDIRFETPFSFLESEVVEISPNEATIRTMVSANFPIGEMNYYIDVVVKFRSESNSSETCKSRIKLKGGVESWLTN